MSLVLNKVCKVAVNQWFPKWAVLPPGGVEKICFVGGGGERTAWAS